MRGAVPFLSLLLALIGVGCVGGSSALPGVSTLASQCAPVAAGSVVSPQAGCVDTELVDHAVVVGYDSQIATMLAEFNDGSNNNTISAQETDGSTPDAPIAAPTAPYLTDGTPTGPSTATGTQSLAHGVYAEYVDVSGQMHILNSEAPTLGQLQADVASWASTESASSAARSVRDDKTTPPDPNAWTKLGDLTSRQTNITSTNSGYAGYPGVGNYAMLTNVYRLNTNDQNNDYYLLISDITMSPNYSAQLVKVGSSTSFAGWGNESHTLTMGPVGASAYATTVNDFGPKNAITSDESTYSVGTQLEKKLNVDIGFKDGGIVGGLGGQITETVTSIYTKTISQPSVTTIVNSGTALTTVSWTDTMQKTPTNNGALAGTTIGTFSSQRSAIFQLPRAALAISRGYFRIGETPRARYYGTLFQNLFFGASIQVATPTVNVAFTAIGAFYFPTFSVAPQYRQVNLQRGDKNGTTIHVDATNATGFGLRWAVFGLPDKVSSSIDPRTGRIGSADVTFKARPDAATGSTFIYINTFPPGGADSLREGSIQISLDVE